MSDYLGDMLKRNPDMEYEFLSYNDMISVQAVINIISHMRFCNNTKTLGTWPPSETFGRKNKLRRRMKELEADPDVGLESSFGIPNHDRRLQNKYMIEEFGLTWSLGKQQYAVIDREKYMMLKMRYF